MKNLGGLLAFLGIGSIVLKFVGLSFLGLRWIDNWGETVAWAIRGGMVVVGAALFLLGSKGEKS